MTAVLVVVFVALSIWMPYYKQQQIVQDIEGCGGSVFTTKGGPDWLRWLVGDERMTVFDRIGSVDLHGSTFTDADLGGLTSKLTNLQSLRLSDSPVTDAGLVHLSGLSRLAVLDLSKTHVSDAGLFHLNKLTKLQMLYLGGTEVSDEGVEALKKALPDCDIQH